MNFITANPTYNWSRGIFARRNPAIATPTTSHASLTFYYDRYKKKFDKKFYSPALTGGRLSSEQLTLFLKDVEHLLKKRSRSVALMVGLFIFVILGGFWMLCTTFDDNYDTTEDDLDDYLFMMVLYFFTMIIFAIGIQRSQMNAIKETRDSVQALIDRNYQIFIAQGLKWNIPQNFPLWIELWTDYREQPVYALPAVQQYNSYIANYQALMMAQQQVQPAPMNYTGNLQTRNQQNNAGYQMIAIPQQQDRNQGYEPLISREDNSENKYPQL